MQPIIIPVFAYKTSHYTKFFTHDNTTNNKQEKRHAFIEASRSIPFL